MGRAPRLLRLFVVVILILGGVGLSCSKDTPLSPTSTIPTTDAPLVQGLSVGPVNGLTTGWHPAPSKFAVTNDVTRLRFRFVVAVGEPTITWKGATEISRNAGVSMAECDAPSPGTSHAVEVSVFYAQAGGEKATAETFTTAVRVLDMHSSEIQIGGIALTEGGPTPEQLATPAQRMLFIRDHKSLAGITDTGQGTYRTAAGSAVHVKTPPLSSPLLIEWRVNSVATLLGSEGVLTLPAVKGDVEISVGPPANAKTLHIQTYTASIEIVGGKIVADKPVTFRVKTEPPGYENEVRWISGTLYGTAEPAFGTGATFAATFERPWPTDNEGVICMGVGASSAVAFTDNPPDMGDDFSRLNAALNDLQREMGEHTCCITDSLAQAQYYQAINELVKTRNAMQHALDVYNALPNLLKKSINIAYGDKATELRTNLVMLEQQIAELNALPDCNTPSLAAGHDGAAPAATLCEVLRTIGGILGGLGLVILLIGSIVAIFDLPLGTAIAAVGTLIGVVGVILLSIANLMGC